MLSFHRSYCVFFLRHHVNVYFFIFLLVDVVKTIINYLTGRETETETDRQQEYSYLVVLTGAHNS